MQMKAYRVLPVVLSLVMSTACATLLMPAVAKAQEMGGDLSPGAGIFRPKNPETKRRAPKLVTKPVTKPVTRPTANSSNPKRPTAPPVDTEERVEDALDEGNEARDARKYAEAEQAYRTAQRLNPHDARAAYGLGNIYTDQQRWEDAEKAYRQAVEFSPKSTEALIALSYVLVQPRTGASNARHFADSELFARRAVELQPTNAIAYDRLGSALEARGIINNETEQSYRRAVELDPQFAVAYVHLARVLRKMNRPKDAEPYYQRAIELAKDAPTLILIADALQSEQRWADSEQVLRRALGLDARNPVALFLLGKTLIVKRQYNDAEPVLKQAIEISPRSFQIYNVLGQAYLKMERYEDAERIYNRASEFAPAADRKGLAGAYGLGGVGDGFIKTGRAQDAVRAYQRALQLDPGNTELQTKLADARARMKG
jgi:tetratricopeptide (TPR) repeat protein